MQILIFITAIAITFFLWVTLMYILSGIAEFIKGMRTNKEALVAHGLKTIVVWLLIGIAGLYVSVFVMGHLFWYKMGDLL
jgi:hypothetical protein